MINNHCEFSNAGEIQFFTRFSLNNHVPKYLPSSGVEKY